MLEFVSHLPAFPCNFSSCLVAFIAPFSSLFIIPITIQYSLKTLVYDWKSSYYCTPSLCCRTTSYHKFQPKYPPSCAQHVDETGIWNSDDNCWTFHFPSNLYFVPVATAFALTSPILFPLTWEHWIHCHKRGLDHLILGWGRYHEPDLLTSFPCQF